MQTTLMDPVEVIAGKPVSYKMDAAGYLPGFCRALMALAPACS